MNTRKILGYALGPIGSAAFGILSLPLISWYYPAEDIGRIVLLQTVSGLAILILGLGLDQSYIREYYGATDKAALFKSIVLTPFLLITAGSTVILFTDASWPSEMIFGLDNTILGILSLTFLLTTLFTRFFALILRMQEKALAFSFSQLTPKFLILAAILFYIATGLPTDTVSLVFAYTFAQVLTVVLLMYQTRQEVSAAAHADWSPQLHKESLRYGLPLAFGNLAYWGLTSVDRFVLKEAAGLEQLGIYSMAVSFSAVALIFQSIFSTIWAPLVFKWVEEKTQIDKIGGITLSMTSLIAAMICFIGIFSPTVTWILPPKYESVQFILLSCMLFPLFYTLTEVTGIGLNIVKKTWLITAVNIIAFVLNLALLYLTVPKWGARGAAMSCAAAFWFFTVIKTELSSRLWRPLPRLHIYTVTALCLVLCLAYTHFGTRSNYYLFALVWAAALCLIGFAHKDSLCSALNTLKGRLKA